MGGWGKQNAANHNDNEVLTWMGDHLVVCALIIKFPYLSVTLINGLEGVLAVSS